jgi:hypothetical protein
VGFVRTSLVVVGSYSNVIVAEMVKDRLAAEGLTAFVADENVGSNFPGLEGALGGIRVLVPREEEVVARGVLANLSHPLGTAEAFEEEGEPDEEDDVEPEETPRETPAEAWARRRLIAVLVVIAAAAVVGYLTSRQSREVPDRPSPRWPLR